MDSEDSGNPGGGWVPARLLAGSTSPRGVGGSRRVRDSTLAELGMKRTLTATLKAGCVCEATSPFGRLRQMRFDILTNVSPRNTRCVNIHIYLPDFIFVKCAAGAEPGIPFATGSGATRESFMKYSTT